MIIGIQNSEYGQRGGIGTYSNRLCRYLNKIPDVKASQFISKYKNGKPDIISIQYEPGLMPPNVLQDLLHRYTEPVIITAHHTLNLEQFYPIVDGVVLHDKSQLVSGLEPNKWAVIPHPALVFPKKDKYKLREKYGLPKDKKIVGTMGFICGTGKVLPMTVNNILKQLNDNEFLYLITSFWKGGDMGRLNQINSVVKNLKKENNFRIDTDFVADEEILNEKMQCCDLLFAWCNINKEMAGSQSGSAADMYGSRVKLIVKDSPHYSFIASQPKVIVGRENPNDFATDVINTLRNKDLDDIQDPTHISWETLTQKYVDFFQEFL